MKKRLLTWLLSVSMLASLLVVPAGAASAAYKRVAGAIFRRNV